MKRVCRASAKQITSIKPGVPMFYILVDHRAKNHYTFSQNIVALVTFGRLFALVVSA